MLSVTVSPEIEILLESKTTPAYKRKGWDIIPDTPNVYFQHKKECEGTEDYPDNDLTFEDENLMNGAPILKEFAIQVLNENKRLNRLLEKKVEKAYLNAGCCE